MKPVLLLFRHGNTFEDGVTPYIVGANQDLLLTLEGERQAEQMRDVLAKVPLPPCRVSCGPLKRTRRFAEILTSGIPTFETPTIDPRLKELDYGQWSGLTQSEIEAQFGVDEISRWNSAGRWPASASFSPTYHQVHQEILEILKECESFAGPTILVTSNGRLRMFSEVMDFDAALTSNGKMKTGNCAILWHDSSDWQVQGWDLAPDKCETNLLAIL